MSSGTFCVDTLYFTVCDCWIGGENVLICFDVNSEIFKEITFPPLTSAGMTFGDLVNIKNELYMFVSTGIEFMWVELWTLEDDHWIKSLLFPPIPPIPLGLFFEITHFMTNACNEPAIFTKSGRTLGVANLRSPEPLTLAEPSLSDEP
ncbi:hypothetical protein R6Q57_003637 [Mikania cordata]